VVREHFAWGWSLVAARYGGAKEGHIYKYIYKEEGKEVNAPND